MKKGCGEERDQVLCSSISTTEGSCHECDEECNDHLCAEEMSQMVSTCHEFETVVGEQWEERDKKGTQTETG